MCTAVVVAISFLRNCYLCRLTQIAPASSHGLIILGCWLMATWIFVIVLRRFAVAISSVRIPRPSPGFGLGASLSLCGDTTFPAAELRFSVHRWRGVCIPRVIMWLVCVVIIGVLVGFTHFMYRGCGYVWWVACGGLGGVSKWWVGVCRWLGLGIIALLCLTASPAGCHLASFAACHSSMAGCHGCRTP